MFLTKLKLGTSAVLCAYLIGGSFTSLCIAQDATPKPAVGRLLDIDGDAFPDVLVNGQLLLDGNLLRGKDLKADRDRDNIDLDGVPVSLADAIKSLNKKASKDSIGKDETPTTEQEVIAGIRASKRPEDFDFNVGDKLYNAFKQIAETRQLPPGATLLARGGIRDHGSFVYDVWWVWIVMPKENGGRYTFQVRERIIRSRTLEEELVRIEKALRDLPEHARQTPEEGGLKYRVDDLRARIAKMKMK